jgi:Zn finger protein HypA/HybF involved in hydrogenase expression
VPKAPTVVRRSSHSCGSTICALRRETGLHKGRAISAEQVAVILECEECRELWLPGDVERWQAYWIDNGPEDKLVFYCPECAVREFASP